MIDFLTCFQDKTEEIYGKVFMSENGNNDTKKISLNRYLSTELDQKTEIDEIGFSLNEKKNSGLNYFF